MVTYTAASPIIAAFGSASADSFIEALDTLLWEGAASTHADQGSATAQRHHHQFRQRHGCTQVLAPTMLVHGWRRHNPQVRSNDCRLRSTYGR